jgi:CRISPR/Cas system-associated exonuclease Cas4 (RecB family)
MKSNNDLDDEYKKLLLYLDENQPSSATKVEKKPSPISKPDKVSKVKPEEVKPHEPKIETIEEFTSIPELTFSIQGFDVKRFETLMRSKLIDKYKSYQSYERPYISVSELLSCIRKSYYSRLKYTIDLSKEFSFSYLYMIQKMGEELHRIIQEIYGFQEIEKTIVSEKYQVKGRTDGIQNEYLFELKTLDPDASLTTYNQNDYYQGNIYAHILNSEYNYKLKFVTILYIFRNLKKVRTFDIPVKDKLAMQFLSRGPVLKKAIASKMCPDPIGATGEECKFCSYIEYCKKDECSKVLQPFKVKENEEQEKKKKEEREKTAFLI